MTNKPLSFRFQPENESKLKALAKREGISLNRFVNNMIKDFSITKKVDPLIPEGILKRLDNLEKELGLQKQRLNITRNRVDFLVKTKNGKEFSGQHKLR